VQRGADRDHRRRRLAGGAERDLGFLYLFPMVLLGTTLNGPALIAVALACTFASDRLDPFSGETEIARAALIFMTLATTGMLSLGITRVYRRELESLERLRKEAVARRARKINWSFWWRAVPRP